MAPAYLNKTTEAVIVSDEPRPDLDALARWHRISDEDAEALLAAAEKTADEQPEENAPEDEDLAKLAAFIQEHDLTAADVLAMLTAEPPSQSDPDAVGKTPGAETADATPTGADGDTTPPSDGGSPASPDASAAAESAPVEPAPAKTRARKTTTKKDTDS